jgi:ribonuclease HIII
MKPFFYQLAKELKKDIGCHQALIGQYAPHGTYQAALSKSDQAVSLAKYLICQMQNRHHAVIFAKMVGMQGYINLR